MKSIAIIGTGIAGMSVGYYLKDKYRITFYERNDYAGGHTNTIFIDEDGAKLPVDTAFMVFNDKTYPNFCKFIDELKVPAKNTSMSFSVQHIPTGLDFSGTGLDGLFSQRKNIFNFQYIKMLLEIAKFNKESIEVLIDHRYQKMTLAEYTKERNYSQDFLNKFLIPMSSAVWSMAPELMLDFPAISLVRFFKNHGFLGLDGHLQWKTIQGGSRTYRDKVMSYFTDQVLINTPVVRVTRDESRAYVTDKTGARVPFDKVVIACHADEALAMLGDPTPQEEKLLGSFRYQDNKTILHTDANVMPKTRRAWSSWNYRADIDKKGQLYSSTIYWMNSLQGVSQKKDYFISINGKELIDPKKIIWETSYAHPVYDMNALKAQQDLPKLNYNGTTFFCGSYFRYGFHEDAFDSGLAVVERLSQE